MSVNQIFDPVQPFRDLVSVTITPYSTSGTTLTAVGASAKTVHAQLDGASLDIVRNMAPFKPVTQLVPHLVPNEDTFTIAMTLFATKPASGSFNPILDFVKGWTYFNISMTIAGRVRSFDVALVRTGEEIADASRVGIPATFQAINTGSSRFLGDTNA